MTKLPDDYVNTVRDILIQFKFARSIAPKEYGMLNDSFKSKDIPLIAAKRIISHRIKQYTMNRPSY